MSTISIRAEDVTLEETLAKPFDVGHLFEDLYLVAFRSIKDED